MHNKLIVFGVVLVAAAVFGFLFWDNFSANQQSISNLGVKVYDSASPAPTPSVGQTPESAKSTETKANTATMATQDDYDSMDKDLDGTDVNGIDSDSAKIQTESSGL